MTSDGSPLPLRHVAEHLIVGAVLLDDVDHVLDQRRLAGARRNRVAGLQRPSRDRSAAGAGKPQMIVLRDCGGVAGELRRIGNGQHANGTTIGMDIALGGRVPPARPAPSSELIAKFAPVGSSVSRSDTRQLESGLGSYRSPCRQPRPH